MRYHTRHFNDGLIDQIEAEARKRKRHPKQFSVGDKVAGRSDVGSVWPVPTDRRLRSDIPPKGEGTIVKIVPSTTKQNYFVRFADGVTWWCTAQQIAEDEKTFDDFVDSLCDELCASDGEIEVNDSAALFDDIFGEPE
jgi:hypothetical protein